MNIQSYLLKNVRGMTDDVARRLATVEVTRQKYEAVMGQGSYDITLLAADDVFPEGFLAQHYVKDIVDPSTGRLAGTYVVPFRDWVVSLTQTVCNDFAADKNLDPTNADVVAHFEKLMMSPKNYQASGPRAADTPTI